MRRAALLVSLLLVLVGCSVLKSMDALGKDLDAAGYEATGLNHNTVNGVSTLYVEVVRSNEVPTEEQADDVAEVVWTKYQEDFDQLQVVINAQLMLSADADELAAKFGDRPAGLTEKDGKRGGMNVTALVVILAIAVAFAGLMVWLWRRGRKPPPPVAPPWPGYPPMGYSYPPQPQVQPNPYAPPPQPPQHPG